MDERRFKMPSGENIKILINEVERYNFTVKPNFEAEVFFRLREKKPEI